MAAVWIETSFGVYFYHHQLRIKYGLKFEKKKKVSEWNRPVGTILVTVTHPDGGDALAVGGALVLIRRTCQWRTVLLVLAQWTVEMVITALIGVDAAVAQRSVAPTFELWRQTGVALTVGLVWTVRTVRITVAEQGWMDAMVVLALVLTRHARELTTVIRLVRPITAIVLIHSIQSSSINFNFFFF